MKEFILGSLIGIVVCAAIAYTSSARASQTMSLDEEYEDGDQKVCVYSDGRHTAVVYKSGAGSCGSKYIKH